MRVMRLNRERIKELAAEAGFDMAGVVPAGPLMEEGSRLLDGLGLGYHGEMGWMERNTAMRTEPREVFPEARSVVAVALNYFTPHGHEGAEGKISRYAWGDDYHDVMRERLANLLDRICDEEPEA